MKANKLLIILETVGMYLAQVPLYLMLIFFNFEETKDYGGPCFVAFLIASGVISIIFIANIVLSIVSIFKGDESPAKVTMISKLALIPWYIFNFVFCAILLSGFLNPFLFMAIPLAMFIMISMTYFYMLSMSLPNVAHFINSWAKKKVKPHPLTIVAVVFLFVFCLDPVGAVIYYLKTK